MSGKKNESYDPGIGTLESEYEKPFNYRDLTTLGTIRTEMVRLYKKARSSQFLSGDNKMDTQDYARYVTGLKELANLIRGEDLERRVKIVEEFMKNK